jgi:hypothetical protein
VNILFLINDKAANLAARLDSPLSMVWYEASMELA